MRGEAVGTVAQFSKELPHRSMLERVRMKGFQVTVKPPDIQFGNVRGIV